MKKIKVHDCVLSQRVPDIRVVKEQEINDNTTHFGLCLSGDMNNIEAICPGEGIEHLEVGTKVIYGKSNTIWNVKEVKDDALIMLVSKDREVLVDAKLQHMRLAHDDEILEGKRTNIKNLFY